MNKEHFCEELRRAETGYSNVDIKQREDGKWEILLDDGGHTNGAYIEYCPYCGEKLVKEAKDYTPWEIPVGEIPLGKPEPCVLGTVKPDEIDYRGGLVSMSGVMGGLEPTLQPYYIRIVRTDEDIEKVMKELEGKIHGGLGVDISHLEGVTPQEVMDKFSAKYQEQVANSIRRMSSPASINGGMMPNPAWEGHMQPQRPACDLSSVNINVEVSPDNVKKIAESIAENINKSVKRGMSR